MKSFIHLFIVCLLASFTTPAAVGFLDFGTTGLLKWTNSVASASYRVESSIALAGPWVALTNVAATDTHVSAQVGIDTSETMRLFRVIWTDAPAAQVLGDWVYQAYNGSGQLVVTGLVSITATSPLVGTAVFNSVSIVNKHPTGSAAFSTGTVTASNTIDIPMPTGLLGMKLSGQMALDEFWGNWSYTDVIIGINQPNQIVTVSGRFSARRK